MSAAAALSYNPPPASEQVGGGEFSFGQHDFERVRKLIYARAGISLHAGKHAMVYSRLTRRLRETTHRSFGSYLQWLENATGPAGEAEWQEFVNCLTTNLTSFFREAHHFEELHAALKAKAGKPIRIWCNAASTGEEPYTIAMTAVESLGGAADVKIVASDIDTKVLATAARGVYAVESRGLTPERQRRHFLRGTGANAGHMRVKPDLARLIEFKPLNLMDERWPLGDPFDIVFCRNVMIYFDNATQRRVLARIHAVMKPAGAMYVGHSENFTDAKQLFRLRGKTIYERLLTMATATTLRPVPAAPPADRLARLKAQPRKPGEASFFFHDAHFANDAVKILPCEWFVHDEDILIMTTLGSCIAACLWDRERKLGGMNHFMLPDGDSGSGRYGSYAMELLINELLKRGASRSTLEAKVFGGGQVIDGMHSMNIGERNTTFVVDYLKTERIPIVSQDVMGPCPRKVCFLPRSGKAMVKRLAATSPALVAQDRSASQRAVPQATAGGTVDLF